MPLLYNATYKTNLRKFSSDSKSVFQSVSLSVCMPVCLSVCLSLSQLVSLSVRMPVRLSVCLSACLSVSQSVCPYACPSVSHSFRPSVCLPICQSVCLSVYQVSSGSIDLLTTSLLEDKFVFFARSSSSPFFISRSLTVRKKANSVCRWLKFLLFIFLKGHKSCAIIFLNTKSTFLVSLLPHSPSIVCS